MAYLLFLMANAALFVRPAELIPSLGNLQVYLYLIVAAIVCSIRPLHNQVRLTTMMQQPINLCVLGVIVAIAFSHVTTGNLSGLATGVVAMTKVALYYLVLVATINTPERLRQFLLTTALCSTAMIALSLVDYFQFNREWAGRSSGEVRAAIDHDLWRSGDEPRIMRHTPDRKGVTDEGEDIWFFRLCGLGIFHDPNDMSLLIAVTAILSGYFLLDEQLGSRRWLWLGPLGLMVVAYYFTFSRGGLLAFGAAGMTWLATLKGGRVALALGALGACVAPIALGRHGNIEVSGGTGQQRIKAWSDGLMRLKSTRILFGIGEGQYAEVAGLVAHNSYVHAFVELGFFGGMLFFGCFFLPAYAIYRIKRDGIEIEHPELRRMLPYIAAILAAWCVGMGSLSRCYVTPTYMICGVCAAYLNLVGYYRARVRPVLRLNWFISQRLFVASAGLLICCFLFVRIFARWG
ncbi:O-antigen ligase domain-containing protein [Maioricimonas sp. JC845]|uniref:O-antigen ligase family protein n=1 Tax=Maioricimonas sp. JC845 TaxID=3232138 RepID=UPI00345A4919